MTDAEYLNMCMSRFDEAVQFHNLINTIKLRLHGHPAAPVIIQILENYRDEALGLGIQEYGILGKQKFNVESGAVSEVPVETGQG